MAPDRQIDTEDAFTWLPRMDGDSLITVLPDAAELNMGVDEYYNWFDSAVELCFAAIRTGPVVFMQTDRLHDGLWLDKSAQIAATAKHLGRSLVWHKIALRRDEGKIDLHRPTYSHVLGYGPARPGTRTPDVIRRGPTLWPNGPGITVSGMVVQWVRDNGARTLLNPFCGMGTIVACAMNAGLDVRGCDIDPGRAQHARDIMLQEPIPKALREQFAR